jgi:bisphosphoglycerate-dependent phosphoglycerate mutase
LFFSSEWNQKNLFCGWYDADLSEKGLAEAKQAGKVRLYNSQSVHYYFYVLVA